MQAVQSEFLAIERNAGAGFTVDGEEFTGYGLHLSSLLYLYLSL